MKTNKLLHYDHSFVRDLNHLTVTQLFEQQAVTHRNRIAIRYNNQHITYYELNAKANILAYHLKACGVQRNTIVALYLERSIEFIIGMLAIIKAGGAYLPIDADGCRDRNKKILRNSKPIKILTSDITHPILEKEKVSFIEHKLLKVASFFHEANQDNRLNPVQIHSTEDMMHVIYTSGSTGEPKGCMIPHRGVVRLVKNTNYIQFTANDCVAQMANAAFDAMTFEVWGALLNGASLYIIPRLVVLSLSDLSATIKLNKISIALITPALLNLLVKNFPDVFDNLRYLLFGGEKANPEIIRTLVERRKQCHLLNLKLINAYGPTECSTIATACSVENTTDLTREIPIGHPISNTTTYVLDKHLRPVPPGQIGELYLGGNGLALGYLNDPTMTAEKFIQAPWNIKEKLYKTGDLVHLEPMRGLIFFGRQDEQQKINGARVTVTEVEASILKYKAIDQAVVKVEHDEERGNYLVAYVSLYPSMPFNHLAFYHFLQCKLPSYMLPTKIIQLDHIPITANGKIDRKHLSEQQGKDISYATVCSALAGGQYSDISHPLEQQMVDILKNILGISAISTKVNIFDLGARSLMIATFCVKLNTTLEDTKKITVTDIFAYPTVRSLANYINNKEDNKVVALNMKNNRADLQRKILIARKEQHVNL